MNPAYFGDSYDIVKRFFCQELSSLGYVVAIDPMLTGDWGGTERDFYRLVGVEPLAEHRSHSSRRALFLDPDTGINVKAGTQHLSFDRLAHEAAKFDLAFSFDQSFSRGAKALTTMREKIAALQDRGCQAMYYDSHARFLFATTKRHRLYELRDHLVALGLPASRLYEGDT